LDFGNLFVIFIFLFCSYFLFKLILDFLVYFINVVSGKKICLIINKMIVGE